MRKVVLFFIIHLSFFICAPAGAQTLSPRPHAFGDGEQLSFTVSWSGINVMRVSIRTVGENLSGRPHYHIIGNGSTSGMVRGFFTLNDTYHSWLDAATLLPSRMTSDQHENDYRHKATYAYNWGAGTVSTICRNATWDADRHSTMPLKAESGDAVALFYRLRQIDVESLVQGRAYPLDLVLERSTHPIQFKYLGREEVKIRRVGRFRALKFTCTMATGDGTSYDGGMTMTLWISDDANHVPLLIEAPVRIGRVRVTLTGGYKVLHPMASLVKD
jgi:hypothetical protein